MSRDYSRSPHGSGQAARLPASRLLALLGVRVCRDTLIQLVRDLSDPGIGQVTVLGVDDFPETRGHSYATLIINMETSKPIDVLRQDQSCRLID